jgi:hypothetical protein
MTPTTCELLIRNQQVSGSNPLVGSSSNPATAGFFLLLRYRGSPRIPDVCTIGGTKQPESSQTEHKYSKTAGASTSPCFKN